MFRISKGYKQKPRIARKEVILAAGACQSPKLLELSGIVDAAILERYSIPVVIDLLHVGENLQDHLVCEMGFEAMDTTQTKDGLVRGEPEALQKAGKAFQTNKTGPLTSSGLLTYAYMPTASLGSTGGGKRIEQLLDRNRPNPENLSEQELARARAYYEIAEKALVDPEQPSGGYFTFPYQIPTLSDPETGNITLDVLPGSHISFLAATSHPLSRGSVHMFARPPSATRRSSTSTTSRTRRTSRSWPSTCGSRTRSRPRHR